MRARAPIRLAVVLLALLGAGGCADSPTKPSTPSYVFTPAGDDVTVPYNGQVSFAVRTTEGAAVDAVFRRGSTILATGPSYTYAAAKAGRDSLRAEVPGTASAAKDWRISVESVYGDRPAPVLGLTAVIGARPGSLRVTWQRATPELNPRPVVRYHVALRRGGALTETNWDAAQMLEEVPSLEATLGYSRDYAGLAGGDTVWVGVRAEDEAGHLSPLGLVPRVRVPGAYWITGTVVGLRGAPLEGIRVSVGEGWGLQAITSSDGSFVLPRPADIPEGLRDIDRYVLTLRDETGAGRGTYYDVRTDTLSVADTYPRQVVLVAGLTPQGDPALAPACAAPAYGGEFLNFLKRMTFIGEGGTRLYHWDHYPVRYWVQPTADWLTPGGFEMGPLAHAAAAAWNARLGGTFFESTPDSVAADLKIIFRNFQYFGYTTIVEPTQATIDKAVPVKMQIQLRRDFNFLEYAQGVVLHEFGHALCIGNHSDCDVHIMQSGARDVPDLPGLTTQQEMEAAITDDEMRLVLYICALPQGINMNQYLLD